MIGQQKARDAWAAGAYDDEVIGIPIRNPKTKATEEFRRDEHMRPETNAEGLAKLRPVFKPDGVVIIGDILFSRVARSNIFGLTKLGARVTLVGVVVLRRGHGRGRRLGHGRRGYRRRVGHRLERDRGSAGDGSGAAAHHVGAQVVRRRLDDSPVAPLFAAMATEIHYAAAQIGQ